MLLYYKAISDTEINWTGQKEKERGGCNAIISDIKDIKKEETESRLGRNYTDLYKICLNIYSWLNSLKVKYIFQSMYLNRQSDI